MAETYILDPQDFDGAKTVRTRVFMEEQGFSNEFDAIDQDPRTLEVCARDARGEAAGCARVFPSDLEPQVANVQGRWVFGRLAVLPEHRRHRLGLRLLSFCEEEARGRGGTEIHLHAQVAALPFYEKAGYVPYGPIDFDEHVEHRWMRKRLDRNTGSRPVDAPVSESGNDGR